MYLRYIYCFVKYMQQGKLERINLKIPFLICDFVLLDVPIFFFMQSHVYFNVLSFAILKQKLIPKGEPWKLYM